MIPYRDHVRPVHHQTGQQPHEPAADRTDALGEQHDLLPFPFCRRNHGKVIGKTALTGHVLQQAAAAADDQICLADSPQQPHRRKTVQGFDLMFSNCISRISGNHGNIHRRLDRAQSGQNRRQQRLVAGVIESVITGNYDFTH